MNTSRKNNNRRWQLCKKTTSIYESNENWRMESAIRTKLIWNWYRKYKTNKQTYKYAYNKLKHLKKIQKSVIVFLKFNCHSCQLTSSKRNKIDLTENALKKRIKTNKLEAHISIEERKKKQMMKSVREQQKEEKWGKIQLNIRFWLCEIFCINVLR